MEFYVIQSTEETGACWVKGMGKDISINGFGSAVKTRTDEIAAQVARTYGNNETDDFLLPNSIWDDPSDWAMGLASDDRFYSYHWSADTGATLQNQIGEIYVAAKATSQRSGFVVVEFYFENYKECKEAQSAAGAEAF